MAKSIYKTDIEKYHELKGKYNSEDLIILREVQLLKRINDTKINKELDERVIE